MEMSADIQTVHSLLRQQTLTKTEQDFVTQRIYGGLQQRNVLAWAELPKPVFAKLGKNGVNQYTCKIWALPKGYIDYPWKVPYIMRYEWKPAQHGCYFELVGRTGIRDCPLNNKLFWGVKISGSWSNAKKLLDDVSSKVLPLIGHRSKGEEVAKLMPGIGINGTWLFVGFMAREAQLQEYANLDELIDDIAGGLTNTYKAFDAHYRKGG